MRNKQVEFNPYFYTSPYEKYLYQFIGAIYVPYMSPIISIGEL